MNRTSIGLGDAAQRDNDPHRLDYIRPDQTSQYQAIREEPPRDWRIVSVQNGARAGAVLGLWLILAVNKWLACRNGVDLYCAIAEPAFALYPLLLLAAGAGAVAWVGVRAWQRHQAEVARASILQDAYSNPIGVQTVLDMPAAEYRQMFLDRLKAEIVMAPHKQLPAGLDAYSPSFHYRNEAAEPLELPPPEPASVPSFSQLLDQGQIGPGRPLILGYSAETGQALSGSWSSLYSVGVGGMTGSGKSWLCAFLISQSAAAGAKLIVIDPHAGDSESLSNRIAGLSDAYMCDVASTSAQIESALKLAASKLEARIAGRGGAWPILLICDEWTSLLRGKLGDLLTATALDIAEQGRKYGVFAMLAAQAWQVDAAGPVRDRLASHYTMRTRGDQFRYQMGLRGSAPLDTLFLHPGQAYFLSVKGDLAKVQIPKMEPGDITRVGALIAQPAAAVGSPFGFHRSPVLASTAQAPEASGKPAGSQPEAKTNLASTATGSQKTLSPEAAALRAELLAGKTVSEAARERNGGTTSGRSYQQALSDVNDLLREMLGGN